MNRENQTVLADWCAGLEVCSLEYKGTFLVSYSINFKAALSRRQLLGPSARTARVGGMANSVSSTSIKDTLATHKTSASFCMWKRVDSDFLWMRYKTLRHFLFIFCVTESLVPHKASSFCSLGEFPLDVASCDAGQELARPNSGKS